MPYDYCLWESSKDRVYQNRPLTENELRENFEYTVSSVLLQELQKHIHRVSKHVRKLKVISDTCCNMWRVILQKTARLFLYYELIMLPYHADMEYIINGTSCMTF
jgi:hypothetical protein